MRIDSHHHLWRYSEAEYSWMLPGWPIRRDFLPSDLKPELDAAGIEACVAVQARQSLEETRWLLEQAAANPWIAGVVGWVDLRADDAAAQLARFASDRKLVGVRHVAQDEPDDRFLVRESFVRGIAALAEFDLAYDLLVFPRQLPACIELVERFPSQRFILDHIAKPPIRDRVIDPWRELICRLAAHPNVWCKVSGLVTEAKWGDWRLSDFEPYLDVVIEAFGPGRLLFGSDWPVCLLSDTYPQVVGLARSYFNNRCLRNHPGFWGANAVQAYRLSPPGGG